MNEVRECVVLQNGGQKIFGMIHRPIHLHTCPAVLICHGLGGHKIGKQRLYVHLAELLAHNGIASLRFDFRGSGDSEGEFCDMTIDSEVSDVLTAIEFLKHDKQCGGQPFALYGRSFGGLVALQAAQHCDFIQSIVLWAPVFNGEQWLEKWKLIQANKVSREQSNEMMKVEGMIPGRRFFEQLFNLKVDSAINAVSHLPLLHIHGEQDAIVNFSHAERYTNVRYHATGENKFVSLPQTDHDFSNLNERNLAFQITLEWLQQTLERS